MTDSVMQRRLVTHAAVRVVAVHGVDSATIGRIATQTNVQQAALHSAQATEDHT